MIADIEWLYKTMQTMKGDFSKTQSKEVVGKSLEFARGMMYQREQDLKEICELKNKFNVKISRLRASIRLFQSEFDGEFNV